MISSEPPGASGVEPKKLSDEQLQKGQKTGLAAVKRTNIRYMIVGVLFFATIVNYADRATLSIVGPKMSKQLGLTHVQMGYLLSAFSWAYVIVQLPGGWLLDRFGSKRIYGWSIGIWSTMTLLQGAVGLMSPGIFVLSSLITPPAPSWFCGGSVIPGQRGESSQHGFRRAREGSRRRYSTRRSMLRSSSFLRLWEQSRTGWVGLRSLDSWEYWVSALRLHGLPSS